MVGLCEGGNEPPGSLKAVSVLTRLRRLPADLELSSGAGSVSAWADYLVGAFPSFPQPKAGRLDVNLVSLDVESWELAGINLLSPLTGPAARRSFQISSMFNALPRPPYY
ncbi:hypothetical protein ANN_07854 [Periplaneta americana]|uniref:Uncharacterized protein n=1 Tax=Periplaneta americana TaxID=6978 RepID=A0ABQ8T158_PERAM|nr:hypothetical protein ANN_07854 [Periplaneta americana]